MLNKREFRKEIRELAGILEACLIWENNDGQKSNLWPIRPKVGDMPCNWIQTRLVLGKKTAWA